MNEEATEPVGTDSLAYAVGTTLRCDALAVEVLDAFEAAGISALLLKGSAHADLYEEGEIRTYTDVDVLVAPDQVARASDVLRGLGFRSILEHAVGAERPDHADPWIRPGSPAVDLHHTIGLATVDPSYAYDLLSEHTEPHELLGRQFRRLDAPARALHIALHAAQHGPYFPRSSADLRRAVASFDRSVWLEAVALARALDSYELMTLGLRVDHDGAALADQLGLPHEVSRGARLKSWQTSSPAQSVDRWRQARGIGAKARTLLRVIAPTRDSIRLSSPLARHGPVGLAAAYLVRPFVVLARLPGAIRDLRRLDVESGDDPTR